MTNGDDYDGLEQAAGGDVRAMAELLGTTFTLVDFESVETRFKDEKTGLNRCTHIARIIPEGEEEEVRYWMGGVVVNRQLTWLKTTGRLPFRVNLGGKGNQEAPYKLVAPDKKPTVKKPPASRLGRVPGPDDPLDYFRLGNGKLDTKAFVVWWQEQGFGPDDLADVVGATSASAVEAWFAADPMRTIQALIEEAQQIAHQDEEELPFE